MSNTPLLKLSKNMSFFYHTAPLPVFCTLKLKYLYCITEIGAHQLRFHAPFTMDTIRERIMFDAYFQCIDILHAVFCKYVNLW